MRGRAAVFTRWCSSQVEPVGGAHSLKKKKPPTVGEERLRKLPEERLEQTADDIEVPPFLERHQGKV